MESFILKNDQERQLSTLFRCSFIILGVWTNKGVALKDQGRLDEAIKACDKAIELNPQDVDPWLNKGAFLNQQGMFDEALKALGMDDKADVAFAKAKE
jgi:tetratricopeptide (TPR) repeat protein